MINLEKAKAVRGWMNNHELEWLATVSKRATVIIEVGCAYGRTTRAIVDNSYCSTLYAVDTWRGSPSELTNNHEDFKNDKGDFAFLEFCKEMFYSIRTSKVVPLRMDSANAAQLLSSMNVKADLIFIDADHSYESVKEDIQNYSPLVAMGGILAGHDFQTNPWPDVTKAVLEIFPDVENPAGHIWMRHN
jgi:predicted O-methyltransferase YrrM